MLEDIIFGLASIFLVIACGVFVGFTVYEGKDERGQQILGKACNVSFVFILFGYVAQSFLFKFGNVTLDFIQLFITVWIAIVMSGNALTIVFLKKRM